MTLTFENQGVGANYDGTVITDSIVMLTTIKNVLTTAGWTVETDAIAVGTDPLDGSSSVLMKALSGTNNHPCWVKFSTDVNISVTDGVFINVEGDLAGDGVTVSTTIQSTMVNGVNNKLWLTADTDCFCLTIVDNSLNSHGVWGGFYKRIDPDNDATAWGVGYLDNKPFNSYLAGTAWDPNLNWRYISEDINRNYTQNNNYTSNMYSDITVNDGLYVDVGVDGVFDKFTVPDSCHYHDNRNETNLPAMYVDKGRVSPVDDKPILGEYYHTEINGDNIVDEVNKRNLGKFFRGRVNYAVTGVASLGVQSIITASNGDVYLSCGGTGWQGMRIG